MLLYNIHVFLYVILQNSHYSLNNIILRDSITVGIYIVPIPCERDSITVGHKHRIPLIKVWVDGFIVRKKSVI